LTHQREFNSKADRKSAASMSSQIPISAHCHSTAISQRSLHAFKIATDRIFAELNQLKDQAVSAGRKSVDTRVSARNPAMISEDSRARKTLTFQVCIRKAFT
jgi:hypothetical protein